MTLANTRHFARAAALLHITQPALTKRIRSLELAWGGALFDRSGASRLTSFGEGLLANATRTIKEADALGARARDAALGECGRLDIGFGLSTIDVAPRIVAKYRARYPRVAVSLNDYASAEQADRLLSGRLDVGFVRFPVPDGLASRPLLQERLALACPLDWAGLNGHAEALNARGFVVLAKHRGPGLAEQISRWCASAGFAPRVVQTADDIQTVLALVAAGVGYGFCRAGRGDWRASPFAYLPCRAIARTGT